jgi:hypothetical protein
LKNPGSDSRANAKKPGRRAKKWKTAAPGREIAIPPRNRAADFSKSRAYVTVFGDESSG